MKEIFDGCGFTVVETTQPSETKEEPTEEPKGANDATEAPAEPTATDAPAPEAPTEAPAETAPATEEAAPAQDTAEAAETAEKTEEASLKPFYFVVGKKACPNCP